MKKYVITGLTLVLLASLLVGCGCTNQDMTPSTLPTTVPVPSASTTEPSTRATTTPTTAATTPTTNATTPHGNGPLDNTTGVTEGPTTGTTSPQRSVPNGR